MRSTITNENCISINSFYIVMLIINNIEKCLCLIYNCSYIFFETTWYYQGNTNILLNDQMYVTHKNVYQGRKSLFMYLFFQKKVYLSINTYN